MSRKAAILTLRNGIWINTGPDTIFYMDFASHCSLLYIQYIANHNLKILK